MQVSIIWYAFLVLLTTCARGFPIDDVRNQNEACSRCGGSSPAESSTHSALEGLREILRRPQTRASKLLVLESAIDDTLSISEMRPTPMTQSDQDRFPNYNLPEEATCTNENLEGDVVRMAETLMSYSTLLRKMAQTEARYQQALLDAADPGFGRLADRVQDGACMIALKVVCGKPSPEELPTRDIYRFQSDVRIVSGFRQYVSSARSCLENWPAGHA